MHKYYEKGYVFMNMRKNIAIHIEKKGYKMQNVYTMLNRNVVWLWLISAAMANQRRYAD